MRIRHNEARYELVPDTSTEAELLTVLAQGAALVKITKSAAILTKYSHQPDLDQSKVALE